VISPFDGSQWVAATVGHANSSEDQLNFFYGHRASRLDSLSIITSGKRGDVAVIDIDPTTTQPVVVNAEVHDVQTGGGPQPVSDAAVYIWSGSSWITPPGSPIETGDAVLNGTDFEVTLTGQDPQLVFSPSGKAVAIWSNLHTVSDLLDENFQTDIDGSWRISTKQGTSFSPASQIKKHICSSNSVTAGEGFQHCVTCDIDEGAGDSGTLDEISAKYSTRNDYAEGDLYYFRTAWQ